MKRILIVKLRPLGDAILAGTCFEAVRKAFPKAWITALVQPPAHELYKKSGWANEVMAYHRGAIDRQPFWTRFWKNRRMVQALKKRQFDLTIDLSASHRSAQLITWGHAGFKIGLGLPDIKKFYDLSAPAEDELKVPAVELDKRILGLIGLEPKPHDRPQGYWPVPEEAVAFRGFFFGKPTGLGIRTWWSGSILSPAASAKNGTRISGRRLLKNYWAAGLSCISPAPLWKKRVWADLRRK